ncbi:hypothetical protein BJY01DRAFT_242373 [Aspergillus pseudoustus]|uniref:Uncharacterized protein n=1 Tax=Aspergillus pseudoustus TaxID=1810923 RepID=A0ABR4KYG0_9EURO
MRRATRMLQLALFFVMGTFGNIDQSYNPERNYRPRNVTELDYYYYPWVGSYYNGSAVFTISDAQVRDRRLDSEIEEDGPIELCSPLENITYSFSYPAILAITETDSEGDRPENTNPIDVALMTSYSNFTKIFSSWGMVTNGAGYDMPFVFESVEMPRPGYSTLGDGKPSFNLTVNENSGNGLPFRVTGSSELRKNPLKVVQMNMTSCSEPIGWWGVVPVTKGEFDGLESVPFPTVQLAFDDASASFSIRSSVLANTLADRSDEDEEAPVTPQISAKLSIEFLGSIDPARSDILSEKAPVTWMRTVGFSNNSMNLGYAM